MRMRAEDNYSRELKSKGKTVRIHVNELFVYFDDRMVVV